jgi:hypothetical protein
MTHVWQDVGGRLAVKLRINGRFEGTARTVNLHSISAEKITASDFSLLLHGQSTEPERHTANNIKLGYFGQ